MKTINDTIKDTSDHGTNARRGAELLGVGALVYAAAAVAPFTQGVAVADVTRSGDGYGYSYLGSPSGSEAFDFIWKWGWSGADRYFQAATVVAMALVGIFAFARMRWGRSRPPLLVSGAVVAATAVYLASVWASPPLEPLSSDIAGSGAFLPIESFRFTTSLVVASVGLLAAGAGVALSQIARDL
jgi:hypothetical protein